MLDVIAIAVTTLSFAVAASANLMIQISCKMNWGKFSHRTVYFTLTDSKLASSLLLSDKLKYFNPNILEEQSLKAGYRLPHNAVNHAKIVR